MIKFIFETALMVVFFGLILVMIHFFGYNNAVIIIIAFVLSKLMMKDVMGTIKKGR